ncbi:MAG: NAD(P)/FAD-dependent oxidoreductase [Terrimicrobiaceae bacterium]|nr:NAD(P)/FAD-dependent oxidoreductase [Terrimicrobiaceae bacterium]
MRDVLIVGGATSGLSAALVLGRCRRSVLVCDAGRPRNRFSRHMHGFLSRDGIAPYEFLRIGREQLTAYPDIEFRTATVDAIERRDRHFAVRIDDGTDVLTRMVLLATGVVDELPEIPGLADFYGVSVHHCPYCDGWEHRDEPIAVFGRARAAAEMAQEMLGWTRDIVVCTHGEPLGGEDAELLRKIRVPVRDQAIRELRGSAGVLEEIVFEDGSTIARKALFFSTAQHQQTELAQGLGCTQDSDRLIECHDGVRTSVPGVFAAGNTSTGLQLAIVAAAEGAKAAWAINQALLAEIGPAF